MKKILIFVFCVNISLGFSQDAWIQINDFPLETRVHDSFTANGTGYVLRRVAPSTLELFEYVIATDSWEEKSNFPFEVIFNFATFSINDEGYVIYEDPGTFDVLLAKYDSDTDTWEQMNGTTFADFGFEGFSPATFSLDGKGYLLVAGNDNIGQFREYNPGTDTWTMKSDYEGWSGGGQLGFAANGKGYFVYNYDDFSGFYNNELREYDPILDEWSQKTSIPDNTSYVSEVAFAINDMGYVGMNALVLSGIFWRYLPLSDEWEQIESCGYYASSCFGFSLGNEGYVGGGVYQEGGDLVVTDQVWKLNPEFLSVTATEQSKPIIFPNPVNEKLHIEGMLIGFSCQIYDVKGSLVLEEKVGREIIDLSFLGKGLYILKITAGDGIFYEKVLKN